LKWFGVAFEEARISRFVISGEKHVASMGNGGNALRNDQKGGLADEKSLLSTISTLWACSNATPKPKPFFKNIPRRIFKGHRDA
jgi:hypothetical protein